MHLALLSVLFASITKSTTASSVSDDFNLGQIGAWNPINLDTTEVTNKQPPLDTDFSQPQSQPLAVKPNSDAPVLEPIEDSVETFQQPYGDVLASQGSTKSPLTSTPGQQLAVDNLPDSAFQSRLDSPPSSLVAFNTADRKKPKCDSIRKLHCCFGDVSADGIGNIFVGECYRCNNPVSLISCICVARSRSIAMAEDTDQSW
ncbi:hypothetical protein MMC07_009155, partial [Pseudocyphellaria aurata]|nr:hypothetical protein [Pseudocyphellaria aurata]